MDKQEALQHLFEGTLRALLSGEKVLKEALAKLADKASNQELKEALSHHQRETEEQEMRLEEIFASLDIKASKNRIEEAEGAVNKGKEALKSLAAFSFKKGNIVMEKILDQITEMLDYFKDNNMIDYLIATNGQLVEQAETIGYEMAIKLADTLGHPEIISKLQQSLEEEKKAYELMNKSAGDLSSAFTAVNR